MRWYALAEDPTFVLMQSFTQFQNFIYLRTYSRWRDDLGRREKWEESVERLITFLAEELPRVSPSKFTLSSVTRNAIHRAILAQEVMPSMRALWAAGDAARASHVTLYNCSYVAVDDIAAFSEILYILMCGTGAGFSVEQDYIDSLPTIELDQNSIDKLPKVGASTGKVVKIVVQDSKEGWAKSLDRALRALWKGHDIEVDYSHIREKGARLKTMGGRASGPDPLIRLMEFARAVFKRRAGKKLRAIDAHDLICMIAEIVVVGGVRRSSLISISDLEDRDMAEAKVGAFPGVRWMANNSSAYNDRPTALRFLDEWNTLAKSRSGERGIFNREGAIKHMVSSGRRKVYLKIGTNPCGEIILRSCQFCNLSSVVIRSNDTLATLTEKVRLATIIGTIQSAFTTHFPFLRPEWQKNCEEERLLGVSLNGIMDHPVLNNVSDTAKKWLSEMKAVCIETNKIMAKKLGINVSAAITCVKPEGTGSQMLNTASGIHRRKAPFYLRRVRISATDPLYKMMRDQGVVFKPENNQEPNTADTWVVAFPEAAPVGAKTIKDETAIEQLEHWLMVKEFWCEHNPSCTVYVGDDEWLEVGAWVHRNFDHIVGLSFFPKEDDHVYQQPPYEEITREQYDEAVKQFPVIDWSKLAEFEIEDMTEGAKSYACTGNQCELK